MAIVKRKYKSRKNGKTTPRYLASVYNPETQQQEWGPSRRKRAEAVQDEADLLSAIDSGDPIRSSKKKFKEVAKLWFESTEKTYAESTWKGYRGYYNSKLDDVFGDIPISKIKPTNAQKYKNILSEKYKPATVNKTIYLLSMIMGFAIDLKLIKDNPCENIKSDKVVPPDHVTWDEKTIGYFLGLEEVKISDYFEMLVLSFTTALRPGEVCGLSVKSLKDNNLLSLNRGYNKYGNITDMKTKGSHRPLSLDPLIYKMLENKLQKKKEQRKEFIKEFGFEIYNDNDFLFTYANGNPINPDTYSKAFKKMIIKHNKKLKEVEEKENPIPHYAYYLPIIRLYDARHSFATNGILNDENAKVLSEIMGTSVDTIMRNYVHLGKTVHQATLSKYSNRIFNIEEFKDAKTE